MFFFGLFSSHIPYVILVLVYLAGYVNMSSAKEEIVADNSVGQTVVYELGFEGEDFNLRYGTDKYLNVCYQESLISEKNKGLKFPSHHGKLKYDKLLLEQKCSTSAYLYRYVALPPPVVSLL